MEHVTKYVIFDTDMGLDDAWALVMLLAFSKLMNIKILAITCVFGNTDLANVNSNTFRILDSMGVKIPVYNGKSKPILPDLLNSYGLHMYYGQNGFGDIDSYINTTHLIEKDVAADAIYKLVKKYPKKITFISVGPLSNLALTLSSHEDLFKEFREIFIMGGNAYGVGNVREKSTAEWNFYMDPEAAHIVLSQVSCPIHILTWEACTLLNFNITSHWRYNGPISKVNSKVVNLITKAEKHLATTNNYKQWDPADAILMSCFLFPETMIIESSLTRAYVEVSGFYTRGQIAVERKNLDLPKNVNFILKVNETAFKEHIIETALATVDLIV